MHDVSIVIPAFQEETRLPKTLAAIDAFISPQSNDVEVLLVDDGSNDTTPTIMQDWCSQRTNANFLVLPHRGKAHAVKTGILSSNRKRIIFMDADLAVPLSEMHKLLEALDQGADVAIGSRESQGSHRYGESEMRRLRGRAFNWLVRLIALRGIPDTQCGFKAFTAHAANAIFSRTLLHTSPDSILTGPRVTAFDVEVLFLARYLGLTIAQIPVRWTHVPQSKVHPLNDPLRMTVDVLIIRLNALRGQYSKSEIDRCE